MKQMLMELRRRVRWLDEGHWDETAGLISIVFYIDML
jgi:hypothetical protein